MWDLRSTQWCYQVFMSFMIWHCVNGWADSHISKDHGAFIHTPGAVHCSVPLDEWSPTFQRIMLPSSTTHKQPNKNSQLALLWPHKHTREPIPHLLQLACHPSNLKLSVTYLPTYFHTYPTLDVLHRLLDCWRFRHYDPSNHSEQLTQHSIISQRPELWIKYHLDLNYRIFPSITRTLCIPRTQYSRSHELVL
jgi:hypothetical protein